VPRTETCDKVVDLIKNEYFERETNENDGAALEPRTGTCDNVIVLRDWLKVSDLNVKRQY
jgi:hypothetical protein